MMRTLAMYGMISPLRGTSCNEYLLRDGFLFYKSRLCVLRGSFQEFLITKLHGGGLVGHFGHDNTFVIVVDRFYWPRMRTDVHTTVDRCQIC